MDTIAATTEVKPTVAVGITPTLVRPKSFTDITKENDYYTAVNYLAKLCCIGDYKDEKYDLE